MKQKMSRSAVLLLIAAVLQPDLVLQAREPQPAHASPNAIVNLPVGGTDRGDHRYSVVWTQDAKLPPSGAPKVAEEQKGLRDETRGQVSVRVLARAGKVVDLHWEPHITTAESSTVDITDTGGLVHEMQRYRRGLPLDLRFDTDADHDSLQIRNFTEVRRAMYAKARQLIAGRANWMGCEDDTPTASCALVGTTDTLLKVKLTRDVTPLFGCNAVDWDTTAPRQWQIDRSIPHSATKLPIRYTARVESLKDRILHAYFTSAPDAQVLQGFFAQAMAGAKLDDRYSKLLAGWTMHGDTECRMDLRNGWPVSIEHTETADMSSYHGEEITRFELLHGKP